MRNFLIAIFVVALSVPTMAQDDCKAMLEQTWDEVAPELLAEWQRCHTTKRQNDRRKADDLERREALLRKNGWTTRTTVDDFEEKSIVIASSKSVRGSPHRSARMFANCHNGQSLNVGIQFGYVNLVGGTFIAYSNGSRRYSIKTKFGTNPVRNWSFTRESGNSILWFNKDEEAVRQLMAIPATENFRVRLPYYREGNVDLTFNMHGAKEALQKVLDACTG